MLSVGDKCWVVFQPSSLTYPEEGNLVEGRILAIEEKRRVTSKGDVTDRYYEVEIGLEETVTGERDVYPSDQRDAALDRALKMVAAGEKVLRDKLAVLEQCKQAMYA